MRYDECLVKFSTTKSMLSPTTLINNRRQNQKWNLAIDHELSWGWKWWIEVSNQIPFPTEIQDDLRVEADGPKRESQPSQNPVGDFQRNRVPRRRRHRNPFPISQSLDQRKFHSDDIYFSGEKRFAWVKSVCYWRHQVMTWSSSDWCFWLFSTPTFGLYDYSANQEGLWIKAITQPCSFSCLCSGQGYPIIDWLSKMAQTKPLLDTEPSNFE